MAKRGRPRKIKIEEPETSSFPEEVSIEGIKPNSFDVEDELESMNVDPYYEDSAKYGRHSDDPMGGIGLNFGDW